MVPVIDDDGAILWESNTIIRYLATSRGRADLLPNDPLQRAQVEKRMDWQGLTLTIAGGSLFRRLSGRTKTTIIAKQFSALLAPALM